MKKTGASKAGQGNPKGDPPKWRKRRLKSIEDVRRYMADLINRAEAGEIEDTTASRLANMANILAGLISSSDLEKRLAALEENQKGQRR
ncbi:MAG: hypothetical protein ACTSU8_05680 [Alphaproteobacteria bacterium]